VPASEDVLTSRSASPPSSSPPAGEWAQAKGCIPYLGTGLPFSS
jgi:hypothetical protein